MNNQLHIRLLFLCFSIMLTVACSNPADNYTEAVVNDAEITAVKDSDVTSQIDSTTLSAMTYAIQPDSTIEFIGSKVTGSHDGGFKEFKGAITIANDDLTQLSGSITIDMNSIWSDNERLTGHLKTADFFEVETYPASIFTATKVESTDEGYLLTGDLNMHGITKSITFPAQMSLEGNTLSLNAEFFIRRFDFDIKYTGSADNLINDEVVLKFNVKAIAQT